MASHRKDVCRWQPLLVGPLCFVGSSKEDLEKEKALLAGGLRGLGVFGVCAMKTRMSFKDTNRQAECKKKGGQLLAFRLSPPSIFTC